MTGYANHIPERLEMAIRTDAYERYRAALRRLESKARELVVARIEPQWSTAEIAEHLGMRTIRAARMASA